MGVMDLLLPLGLAAIGLVVLKVCLLTVSSVQRLAFQRRQQELSLRWMRQRIDYPLAGLRSTDIQATPRLEIREATSVAG